MFEIFDKAYLLLNFNLFVFLVNLAIFFSAKRIILFLDTSDLERKNINWDREKNIKKKTRWLQIINFIICFSYFATLFSHIDFLNDLIKALFVIVLIFIINGWIIRKIVVFYGEEIEVNNQKFFRKWYKSNLFSLLVNVSSTLISILIVFQILWFDNILKTGWAIAWILAFVWFTAPVWAPDMVAGIIILHNDRIQTWNVIKIKELGILAWVKTISLSEIKLIDLRYNYPILLRPSKLREYKVENLSLNIIWSKNNLIQQTIDLKVWYENTLEEVEKVCYKAYENMIGEIVSTEHKKYFPKESANLNVEIEDFGDYAIVYKFSYYINSPFYIIKAKRVLNKYLQIESNNKNISFSTPDLLTETII